MFPEKIKGKRIDMKLVYYDNYGEFLVMI